MACQALFPRELLLQLDCIQSGLLSPTAYGDFSQQATGEGRSDTLIGRPGEDQRHAVLFSQSLQPGGDVDRIAEHGVIQPLRRADVARDDRPGGDAS